MLNRNWQFICVICLTLVLGGCSSLLADLGLDDPGETRELANNNEDPDCNSIECRERRPQSYDRVDPNRRVHLAIRNNDIVVGMSRSQVVKSWGEPAVREVAGSGARGHERWTYGSRFSLEGERYLIFENGEVVGWHR